MYYKKLFSIVKDLNFPVHEEFVYISFTFQESRVRIESLDNNSIKTYYSDDKDLLQLLDEIYSFAISLGFDSIKLGCSISLEDSKLVGFPNTMDFFDSLDEEEEDDFFEGNLNYDDKKFIIEDVE